MQIARRLKRWAVRAWLNLHFPSHWRALISSKCGLSIEAIEARKHHRQMPRFKRHVYIQGGYYHFLVTGFMWKRGSILRNKTTHSKIFQVTPPYVSSVWPGCAWLCITRKSFNHLYAGCTMHAEMDHTNPYYDTISSHSYMLQATEMHASFAWRNMHAHAPFAFAPVGDVWRSMERCLCWYPLPICDVWRSMERCLCWYFPARAPHLTVKLWSIHLLQLDLVRTAVQMLASPWESTWPKSLRGLAQRPSMGCE